MNTRETDFLKFEEELLNTRKKLNDLIQEYHAGDQTTESQPPQESERKALYQDKINFWEAEIRYLHSQLLILKMMNPEVAKQKFSSEAPELQVEEPKPHAVQNAQTISMPQVSQNIQAQPNPQAQQSQQRPQPMLQKTSHKPQEYEKMFDKSLMGIFASVLIFISLTIFATLVIPYLNDTMKLIGLYVLSFGILGAGLFLYRKKKNNFYVAVIGCGAGSLYLSLLMSNLYFKVLGDIALYCFILVWAVLVKNLTRLKNLVFQIIGQAGIFIATVMGTVLCVNDGDENKFFVLTVFYLLSSCVFAEIDKAYLRYMTHFGKDADAGQTSAQPPCYEQHFFNHFCKT